MVSGSARNVRFTKPPSVATAHAATKTTKNAMPSAIPAARETGTRGLTAAPAPRRSLDEAGVDDRGDLRHALDDPELQQQLARLLAEGLVLAGEELAIRLAVL